MILSDESDRPSKEFILADLKRAEKFLKRKLPEDLRDFFFRCAGCSPEPDTFRIPGWPTPLGDENQEDSIDWFLGGENQPLADLLDDMRSILRPEYVPFAECGGGDLVCYSLAPESLGSVWYWDHEDMGEDTGEDDDPERAAPWSYHKCADSLQGFLDGLYEFDDSEIEEQTKDYVVDPVDRAFMIFSFGVYEALEPVFENRPDFTEEAHLQWTRELPTVYQTVSCCANKIIEKKGRVYDVRCVQIFVNLSPKSPFAVWKDVIPKKRFASVLKKLEWYAEYNQYRHSHSYCGSFFSEHPIESVVSYLDEKLGIEWRERNDPAEMANAYRELIDKIINEDVAQLLAYCDKYKDDVSLYEGYLKGEVPSTGVQFTNIPYEFYLATWFYKRGDYAEAYRYVVAYVAKYEALSEKDQKFESHYCYGRFAKYIRDYLETLVESSK